ncbi:MAG: hypothetical protein IJH34_05995 [Romboutsia sp.]|nr:hypothetical protein [Romboutsia sp.]
MINEIDIDVKNPGLLEVPAGKEVDQLPKSHFEKLIAKKGYEKIIRGLTNLEVWNKNKNPKLSKWASNMADSLKHLQPASESMQEASAKLQAFMKGGKEVAKKTGQFFKNRSGKMLDTAQNAIVAGAVAPVGAGIAQKYANKSDHKTNSPKKTKDKKYSSAELAAIATAMRNKSESLSNKLYEAVSLLEKDSAKKVAKGVAIGAGVGGAAGLAGLGKLATDLTGGVTGTVATGPKGAAIKGVRTLAKTIGGVQGALKGGAAGGIVGGAKAVKDKAKEVKDKVLTKSEQLIQVSNTISSILEASYRKEPPKKETTPEQKAKRQERRKIKRQLKSQGLDTTRKRANTEIPQLKSLSAAPHTSQTAPHIEVSQPVEVKKPEVKKPSLTPEQIEKMRKDSSKTAEVGKAHDYKMKQLARNKDKAEKVFKKSQTLKKFIKGVKRKSFLAGAATTAALGAGGYLAKKAIDKNKKNKER